MIELVPLTRWEGMVICRERLLHGIRQQTRGHLDGFFLVLDLNHADFTLTSLADTITLIASPPTDHSSLVS